MPPDDFADATADNITGNGLNLAVFQFGETAAGFLFPSGFNLWLNVGVQCGCEAIHHFRHLFARQMARFFDDLIQCHRHDGKLRRNHAGRNGEFSFPTGRSGFRQKAALIIFPEEMRHLPAAATTASGSSAFSERRRRGIFVAQKSKILSRPWGAALSADAAPDGAGKSFGPGFYKDAAPTALKIIMVLSRWRLMTGFHFQPGAAAFGRKPHSPFFPKPCGICRC
jgi:hypothetical protein